MCRCGCTGNEKKLSVMATGGIGLYLKGQVKDKGHVFTVKEIS